MNTTASKVFVVDDDPSILTSMVRLLRASGYSAQGFNSAREALKKIPVDGQGCILVDLHMPEMGGIKLKAVLAQYSNPITVVRSRPLRYLHQLLIRSVQCTLR
jgi:FixJ family two-component response regulator